MRFLLVAVLALAALSTSVLAQAPDSLSFQGFVTDTGGAPINNPSVSVIFKLYEGSSEIWSETQPSVKIVGGVFNVLLGSVTPLDTVRFNRPLLLGIKVGSDSEISPRTPLAAAAYAKALPGMYTFYRDDGTFESHNVVGGGASNVVGAGVTGATISGGGGTVSGSPIPNQVTASFGSIGGGLSNTTSGDYATVGGGDANTAAEVGSTVGGGFFNRADGETATVGGGDSNRASGPAATVGGGDSNTASGTASTVGGGRSNTADGPIATVGGGWFNMASREGTVGGGQSNTAGESWATVGGGLSNTASAYNATVGGGWLNVANGIRATVPGGFENRASGLSSFAAGWNAKALHNGTFVWKDGSGSATDSLVSTGDNQFLIRAGGGVGIGTNSPLAELHVAHGSLAMTSSAVHEDEIIVEASDAVLGLYSSTGLSWGSALVFGQMSGGALVDKWALVRGTTSAGNNLHLKFGTNANSPLNASKVIFFSNGGVDIAGTLSKGGGAFKIDHPLDPTNKFLFHSFVESPDMKNIYDGIAILDDSGEATVEMPSYFEALNQEFRYQLTCIGGFATVYISSEVENNRFGIAGGAPGMKVSWMLTGIRKDAFAEQNRIEVEVDKDTSERGTYLHPEAFGASN